MSKVKEKALPTRGAEIPVKKAGKKKKKKSGALGRFVRRFLLVLLTALILTAGGLWLVLDTVFNGPSETARNALTMSLLEFGPTRQVPSLFLGEEQIDAIRSQSGAALPEDRTDVSKIIITQDSLAHSGEWADFPDGIRIEEYRGGTYNARITLIRDPAQVVPEASTDGAIAAIPAGGTSSSGSAYAGFTDDHILMAAKSLTAEQAAELNIRDGAACGPLLILNGVVNQELYNGNSGCGPRTALGQRADGTVIFLRIDGYQPGSIGGTWQDVIDILVEYGAVNACGMGDDYSLTGSSQNSRFWVVRPGDKED